MPVKKGKAVLRSSLDEELIVQLKIAAIRARVHPNKIVAAALHLYLSDSKYQELLEP